MQIKVSYKNDEERRNAMHHKKSKYHVGRGKRLKRFGDGWTDNGREYYQELLMIFKELKSSDILEYTSRSLEIVSKETLCQR